MIRDHVDLMVEFASQWVEVEGMDMLCGVFIPSWMNIRSVPFWVEFYTGGTTIGIVGSKKYKTRVDFPIHEKDLGFVLRDLLQAALEGGKV
jgi:hypothetical protein